LTQLGNKQVFKFSPHRTWRHWCCQASRELCSSYS